MFATIRAVATFSLVECKGLPWPVKMVLGAALASSIACSPSLPTCLGGSTTCEDVAPCAALDFQCDRFELWVGRVESREGGIDLAGAQGHADDVLLTNGIVTMVLDDVGAPRNLVATGGTVIDFGPSDGDDHVNQIYQLAGILPDDAFAYDSVTFVDRPTYVAAIFRGTLEDRPDVEVVTRYELHPCDPGVRVRSELRNGSADVQAFVVADAAHWGKRDSIPFSPLPGQGFSQPELDLIELQASYDLYDYVAARPMVDQGPTYGFVRCDREQLEGVNDTEISAIGTGIELVRPGESMALDRFWLTTGGADLSAGTNLIASARSMLHGDSPAMVVRGRLTADGLPFAGDIRRASLIVAEDLGDTERPLTMVVPSADGTFQGEVPQVPRLTWQLWSFGRIVGGGSVASTSGIVDLGDLEIELPATVGLSVVDPLGRGLLAEVVFHPADEATRTAVRGTYYGALDECAPWLGPPLAASPACNRVLVGEAGTDVAVPSGRYEVYAVAGPERTIARQEIDLAAGDGVTLEFVIEDLEVAPPEWLHADLHVHGRRSFDSSVPDFDRVATFVTAGLDVIAATDHDWVTDYADALETAGLSDRVAVIGGVETTPLVPFLEVPGEDIPRVVGHFNFWPLRPDDSLPRAGAPFDERLEPGELFDLMAPLVGGDGALMMNHPWDDTQFGRDLGYLRAIKFDPRVPIGVGDEHNDVLLERPGLGHRNVDFNLIEIGNGAGVEQVIKSRVLWFSLLSQGFLVAGTANSDSHSLATVLGFARTMVMAATSVDAFDVALFNQALRQGRASGGNGVVIVATLKLAGETTSLPGFEPVVPSAEDTIEIEVRAAPWIPVTEVRAITSRGTVVIAEGADIARPFDPFGRGGLSRWQASIKLADLIDPGTDDWLILEAGIPYFATADIENNGVPDTTDNNGDGVIDQDDVEEDEDSGPLEQPADPISTDDIRYVVTRVIPKAWPYGFTNPLLVDWAGDGWTAPGLGAQ